MLDQVLELMADYVLALDLELIYEVYRGEYSDTEVDPPLPDSFPRRIGRRRALTWFILTLKTNLGSISDALDRFLQECPDLRRLTLCEIDKSVDTVELSRLFGKNCPNLTELAFKGPWSLKAMANFICPPVDSPAATNQEEELQKRTMDSGDQQDRHHPQQQQQWVLRSFSYTDAYACGQRCSLVNRLQSHWSTLESVEIDGLRILPQEIEVFLTRCPRLEHLSINATEIDFEFISVLDISSFRPSIPWVCLGLKSICLEIGDGCEYCLDCELWLMNQPDSSLSPRPPHPDVLAIYQRLSELTALESIQLGFSHSDSIRRRTARSDLGFNFSLASGLGLLKTLKSLKKLAFFQFEEYGHWLIPDIGQAEVEWMAENWPNLQEIQLNIERPEEGEESAGEEQWKWLKERRPDINVRFAHEDESFE